MEHLKLDTSTHRDYSRCVDSEGSEENGEKQSTKKPGLGMVTGSVYILGELIGIGVLALPRSAVDMGISGLPILVLLGVVATYTAVTLSQCWVIVEERYNLVDHVHDPYPTIGYYTFGTVGRYFVSVSNNFSLVGVAVVLIILGGELLEQLFKDLNADISFCYWILVFAAVLIPIAWMGTPKDMSAVAIGSAFSTIIAIVLLFAAICMAFPKVPKPALQRSVTFGPFVMAMAKVTYTYSGHMGMPTIQIDMKDRKAFYKVVILSFVVIVSAYFPVACAGYLVLGDLADDDLIITLNKYESSTGIINVVQVLMVIHILTAAVINLNPVFQELEKMFNVENAFGIRRVLLRTLTAAMAIFVAETVPRFGNVLSLIGGSTLTLLNYILPLVFYEKLIRMKGDWPERTISLPRRVLNYEIIIVGIIMGVASTYSAIEATFAPHSWVPPCYVNLTYADQA